MAKVIDTKIRESAKQLKELIRTESSSKKNVRLRALYLIKTKQVKYKSRLADLLGYNRTSIREWLQKYEEGGLESMLDIGTSPGRTSHITAEMAQAIKDKLDENHAYFQSYGDVVSFIKSEFGVELPYNTLHRFVHYKLGTSLKEFKNARKFRNFKEGLNQNSGMYI